MMLSQLAFYVFAFNLGILQNSQAVVSHDFVYG